MGKVFVPHAEWVSDILGQLMRFPAGKHDDAVDVFGLIGRGLEFVKPPKYREPDPEEDDEWGGSAGGAWMG